jgi:hypothetical protein
VPQRTFYPQRKIAGSKTEGTGGVSAVLGVVTNNLYGLYRFAQKPLIARGLAMLALIWQSTIAFALILKRPGATSGSALVGVANHLEEGQMCLLSSFQIFFYNFIQVFYLISAHVQYVLI